MPLIEFYQISHKWHREIGKSGHNSEKKIVNGRKLESMNSYEC